MGSLGGTREEGWAGRAVFFLVQSPWGHARLLVLSAALPGIHSGTGWKDKCFSAFNKIPILMGTVTSHAFQPRAGMLSAPDCAQPPVPTSACALRRLTSFQACGGESPVAQGSAAAAANGQGQRRGEAWKM